METALRTLTHRRTTTDRPETGGRVSRRLSREWMAGDMCPGLVSVIIPTYNRGHLISETLNSVWQSHYRPIEIVVVDDGSTDNTKEIVKMWADDRRGDSQFQLKFIGQEYKGACATRNLGLRHCYGEYIQFLDSDDILDPKKISLQVEFLIANREVDFAYGPVLAIESPSRIIFAQSGLTLRKAIFKQLIVPTFTTLGPLCRRSMVGYVGPWDESLGCAQDWEYFSRACVMECIPGFVPSAKSYFRAEHDTGGRIRWRGETERVDEYIAAQFRRLESTLGHATPAVLSDPAFKDAVAWELAAIASKAVKLGWSGDVRQRYRQAVSIAMGMFPRMMISTASIISAMLGMKVGATWFNGLRWLYFRREAAYQKIRRALC